MVEFLQNIKDMNIIRYPEEKDYKILSERPHLDKADLTATVRSVLDRVRNEGDIAVRYYEQMFDHVDFPHPEDLKVTQEEMDEAENLVDEDLKASLLLAYGNIKRFHEAQRFESQRVTTMPGVTCWQKSVPIERVGLYVPGGTAPLFSTVLMLATPAKIAGCKEIVLCTPPNREGKVHPAILVAARISGVSQIFKAGGAQAIAAMAYGNAVVPKVDKIFGPGNQYVMAAKQQVSLDGVGIDMPAGPSEVCVIADRHSDVSIVSADLLSQAEHGPDSQVVLVTDSERLIDKMPDELDRQLQQLPRRDIAIRALEKSTLILVKDTDEAIRFSNEYAPEHLIIYTRNYEELADKVVNAGSVFLGRYACESAGDYASGTNHTLPTSGYARSYSGVNLDSYCRKITFQHLTEEGIQSIGHAVETMAAHEQLQAHKNAMTLRFKPINEEQ